MTLLPLPLLGVQAGEEVVALVAHKGLPVQVADPVVSHLAHQVVREGLRHLKRDSQGLQVALLTADGFRQE